jgi:D-glycero-D-manno-heptose 1,7-bisphosphate phosphatase
MTSLTQSRALFLDRDGVINIDHGYVHRKDQVDFVEGIFDVCRHACSLDYYIIVVTNQAGIGRGYYSQLDFEELMIWMKDIFAEQGCPMTDIYWCPYHPTAGVGHYRRDSFWRKPKPGMILAAANRYSLELKKCVLIGDKISDLEAGKTAGVGHNILYKSSVLGDSKGDASVNTIYYLVDAINYL